MHRFEVLTAPPSAHWVERRVPAMGSEAHLIAGDAGDELVDWAVAELERLEQAWSRFRPDGALAKMHAQPGEWVEVGHALLLAMTCAQDLFHATDGAFDPTVRDALERAGYDRTFTAILHDDANAVEPAHPAPGFGAVEIDVDRSAVRLPAGVHIDLGGVGKGLAADLVARGLVERGARSALVSVGGDMRAYGEAPRRGWIVPVEGPFDDRCAAFHHTLTNGALVQSTTQIRQWTRAGRVLHHIIDPATGEPTDTGIVAAVVAARDAWWAEGIAKAMMIRGLPDARSLVAHTGVHAWAFLADGCIVELGVGA
jgi:thiamine biosynthesis lipoprotein